jgi:hypothetical protein
MKHCLAFIFSVLLTAAAIAQSDMPGIRNTGFLPCLQLSNADKVRPAALYLQEKTTKVQLYPGFAVTHQTYLVKNEDTGAITARLGLPVEGFVNQAEIGQLFFTEPHAIRLCVEGQKLVADTTGIFNQTFAQPVQGDAGGYRRWYSWKTVFLPGKTTTIAVQAIVRTSLSRYIKDEEARDGNAFALRLDEDGQWKRDSTGEVVMVHLQKGLKLTDIWGIKPDSLVQGDFTHLLLQSAGKEQASPNFLVWYQGAPPDFKFDTKILPFADTLYTIMERFPTASFKNAPFDALHRNNFYLSPAGLTFSGVLYFLMFTIPWMVLAGFIIFLLKGKKKKQ